VSVLMWVIYDISDDRVRNKIAKECKKYGLERVQKSVFLGRLQANRYNELTMYGRRGCYEVKVPL